MPRYNECGRNAYRWDECGCGPQRRSSAPPPCSPPPRTGCQGPAGKSAYQIAVEHGFVGTVKQWLESLKGKFQSSYAEALGSAQVVPAGGLIAFDPDIDSVGNNITVNSAGTVFTITRPGLYLVEWDMNLAEGTTNAIMGIVENGEGGSGASASTGGNFSSGTLIEVTTVPFTISLRNYNGATSLVDAPQWQDSAASIRIVRFADGPSV